MSSADALHPNRPSSSSVVLDVSANSHASLTVVSAEVPRAAVDALIEALAEAGVSASSWDDVESANSRLSSFLPAAADAPGTCQAFVAAGCALGLDLHPTVATLPEQDWAESWKRFFRVQRVSERIVIRPTWEPYEPQPGDCVVDLDPGMSFGTGNHATTQACLQFLDALALEYVQELRGRKGRAGPPDPPHLIVAAGTTRSLSASTFGGSGGPALPGCMRNNGHKFFGNDLESIRRRVLDMGCGSGILAIAARKLGFAEVAAFDNDPDAVAIARENAADNGTGVVFEVCDLAQNTRQADVVVANILAPVLIAHAGVIAAAVKSMQESTCFRAPGPAPLQWKRQAVIDAQAGGRRASAAVPPRPSSTEQRPGALILSGILDTQYAAVRAAYEAQGFVEEHSLLIGEWRSGLFVRRTS